jgi:hypothetical protein
MKKALVVLATLMLVAGCRFAMPAGPAPEVSDPPNEAMGKPLTIIKATWGAPGPGRDVTAELREHSSSDRIAIPSYAMVGLFGDVAPGQNKVLVVEYMIGNGWHHKATFEPAYKDDYEEFDLGPVF